MYSKEIANWQNCELLDEKMKQKIAVASEAELKEMIEGSVEFGTGGMRGVIGPGENQINQITISRAAYGFGKYLNEKFPDEEVSVVIGYDNRHYSPEFAKVSAEILSALGINAKLFSRLTATPVVSYAIRELDAKGGIMITASHNPPQYNGFKIYDETGCQFLPDEISSVITQIKGVENEFQFQCDAQLVEHLDDTIENQYIQTFDQYIKPDAKEISIGYSGQHGTGSIPVKKMFSHYHFEKVAYVASQEDADPNFTNTKNPNPEDPAAFEALIELGKQKGLEVLLTTDPDADRMGTFYLDSNGEYIRLNGNQIGAIFSQYLSEQDNEIANKYLVKTIVTSDLGAKIAEAKGAHSIDVLTGFKYIGDIINREGDKDFLLGYEESFGYLFNPIARDKDGLQAVLLLCEIANQLKQQGQTLGDYLGDIYNEFGVYLEDLISIELVGVDRKEKLERLFSAFEREFNEDAIVIENYETSQAYDVRNDNFEEIMLPKERVIKFRYEDGSWVCIRPSGTEPKMKIYLGVTGTDYGKVANRLTTIQQRVAEIQKKVG